MAKSTACNLSLLDPGLDDCQEKTLLPPTDTDAEVMEIPGYKLVYVNGACPRNYRVYKGHSMIGVIFQYITHWSNAVDKIRYTDPVNAAVGLDDFMTMAGRLTTATEQPLTEEELLDKEFDALTSDEWERLKRYVPQACLFSCSVRETGGQEDPPVWQGAELNSQFIQIEQHNSSDKPMEPIEILKQFNSCYLKIQAIAQDENWLLLIASKRIDPEAATQLGDVLHYLGEVMGCVEEIVEVKFNQEAE